MARLEPLSPRCKALKSPRWASTASLNFGFLQADRSRDISHSARLRRLQVAAGFVCTFTTVGPHSAMQCLSLGIRLALLESLYGCCYARHFALNPKQRDGEAANIRYRFRRRGPGAALATKRSAAKIRRIARGARDVGFNGIDVSSDAKFRILHINIRGWTSQVAALIVQGYE